MDPLFICYPKCGTCQKAKRWLDAKGLPYRIRHIVDENPTRTELALWVALSGKPINKFFNTSGILYREMALSSRLSQMSTDEQLDVLAVDGMLVKRPLLITGKNVLVGFKEAEWEALLNDGY